jgi:hypothetical protein
MRSTYAFVEWISLPQTRKRSVKGSASPSSFASPAKATASSCTTASPEPLSSAPGPPESESPCAQKSRSGASFSGSFAPGVRAGRSP